VDGFTKEAARLNAGAARLKDVFSGYLWWH
jgi:hypothetical protein